ncbi:DNA-processing protein DprA [Flavobacteriaceae bacterium]|nr:DNA-processing protein DprA [Flavobacteriaceae bacterium]
MKEELSYWLALAHLPKLRTKKKNEIIVRLFEEQKTIIDFFHFEPKQWKDNYELSENEILLFQDAIKELSNYAFLVEDLLEQGYSILPITSPEYSPILKKNLGRTYAPPLIYTKGNKAIMSEKSVAIVGSRKADKVSLDFTDNVAKTASKDYKVVVSGFAKGVDKQALDSALKYKGQSIIVLPQGIATFNSGFKKYYKQIIDGDVMVLSTFYPKATWSVGLAMARNPIIYGLATEIFVAESSNKGGTWSGVVDGLRKGRKIYVRKPGLNEKNANNLLIQKGAVPVNSKGDILSYEQQVEINKNVVSEPDINDIEYKIIEHLKKGVFTSKKIVETLKLDWSSRKVSSFLKKQDEIITVEGKPLKFSHKERTIQSQKTLFG